MPEAAAPTVAPAARSGRGRRGYLVPGSIALVVLAVLAVVIDLVGLTHRTPDTLAGPDVATRIAQGIQAGAGDHRLPQVSCPTSEPARAGVRFTCAELPPGGGAPITIQVTETGAASYTWHPVPAPVG
ncbi:MAG TPA: DUF4333 domain-containing protein [Acidimicrobiales bacterium]|nr:DUF4333 domain-containing protein [Acidimicrobiales bacterium]